MSFPPSAPQQPAQPPAGPQPGQQAPQQPQFSQQPPAPQAPQGPQAPQAPPFTQAPPTAAQQPAQRPAGAPQVMSQPPAYPAQAPTARPTLPTTLAQTNTYALVSIILVFLAPIAGIIFGHLGLSQIKRTNDAGRGMALTAVILGYAYVAFILLFIVFYVSLIGILLASAGAAVSEFGSYETF